MENELITRMFSEHSDRLLSEAHAKTHTLATENIKLRAGIEARISAKIEAANRAQIARLASRL